MATYTKDDLMDMLLNKGAMQLMKVAEDLGLDIEDKSPSEIIEAILNSGQGDEDDESAIQKVFETLGITSPLDFINTVANVVQQFQMGQFAKKSDLDEMRDQVEGVKQLVQLLRTEVADLNKSVTAKSTQPAPAKFVPVTSAPPKDEPKKEEKKPEEEKAIKAEEPRKPRKFFGSVRG